MKTFSAIMLCFLVACGGSGEGSGEDYHYIQRIYNWQAAEIEAGGYEENVSGKIPYFSNYELVEYLYSFGMAYIGSDNRDYWKTLSETKRDRGGDCEDLANAYLILLREFGNWPDNSLVVVLIDVGEIRDHAIVAYETPDGTWKAIDQSAKVPIIKSLESYLASRQARVILAHNLFDVWEDAMPWE